MEIIYSKSAQLNFHLTWSRKFAIDEQKAQFNIPRLFCICMYACICCCGSLSPAVFGYLFIRALYEYPSEAHIVSLGLSALIDS